MCINANEKWLTRIISDKYNSDCDWNMHQYTKKDTYSLNEVCLSQMLHKSWDMTIYSDTFHWYGISLGGNLFLILVLRTCPIPSSYVMLC